MSAKFLRASLRLWRWRRNSWHRKLAGTHGEQRKKLQVKIDHANEIIARRKRQLAQLGRQVVASPLKKINAHSWGYHPGVHDGVDLICDPGAPIYAICDAEVVDVRSSGWWGKGAQASGGHPVSDGDGIIQLKCLVDLGPFKKGMHFGYGHAEGAVVHVGQTVQAGQHLGHAGFANAWHVHFMANDGSSISGRGDRDPWPYVAYAIARGED